MYLIGLAGLSPTCRRVGTSSLRSVSVCADRPTHQNRWPIVVAVDEQFMINGGASASAPIFASLITAINDARIAVGKKPVGWINPAVRVLVLSLLPVRRLIFV